MALQLPATARPVQTQHGTVPVDCVPASGQTLTIGATTVDCTATNSAGNSAHSSFHREGEGHDAADGRRPCEHQCFDEQLRRHGRQLRGCHGKRSRYGPLTPVCAPASGSTFPVGMTTVNCTATDAHSNAGHASFTVTVTLTGDTTRPTLRVPANITKEATGPAGAVVTYTVTATDPDNTAAQITIVCTSSPTSRLSSGSIFPIATTTVTCNAHDPTGNNALSSNKTTACRAITKFISDLQTNTAPQGPITAAHSILWISEATQIRTVRGC
jgi:HYR domain